MTNRVSETYKVNDIVWVEVRNSSLRNDYSGPVKITKVRHNFPEEEGYCQVLYDCKFPLKTYEGNFFIFKSEILYKIDED
jgi:hypothetical protein